MLFYRLSFLFFFFTFVSIVVLASLLSSVLSPHPPAFFLSLIFSRIFLWFVFLRSSFRWYCKAALKWQSRKAPVRPTAGPCGDENTSFTRAHCVHKRMPTHMHTHTSILVNQWHFCDQRCRFMYFPLTCACFLCELVSAPAGVCACVCVCVCVFSAF